MATINNLNTIYANQIYKIFSTGVSEIGEQFATRDYVDSQIVSSGGVTQQDLDDNVASLTSKDIAYNNTLTSHISLIDTNSSNIQTNITDISILNTKQQQNFFNISSLTHLLNTDYQTTTQLNF